MPEYPSRALLVVVLSKKQKWILFPFVTEPGRRTGDSSKVTTCWACQWYCPSPAYRASTRVGTLRMPPDSV